MASWQSSLAPTLNFAERRRYLVLFLPLWETDCLRRDEPGLVATGRPLALWEKDKGAMRLAAADARAAGAGLAVGQSLSDARAIVPALELREIDRHGLGMRFGQFADWHSYASPIVAVLVDRSPYGDLALDISGVSHLFGGERAMLQAITGRLERLGFTVQGAVAHTIGAAWALAHFLPGHVAEAGIEETLAPLPVAALRLDGHQIAGLDQMGLKRIGQLYERDRRALEARFGHSLMLRLDQALGRLDERLVPRVPVADHKVERRFAEPIGLIDDVLACTRDLAIRLSCDLEAAGLGAQTFHLLLYRVDHKLMQLSVNAARATREAAHIASLFAHRSERLGGEYDAGFGIDMIRLGASSLARLDSTQVGAFETHDGTADLDRLYDRMASRLGPLAVLRSKPVNTHIPERAVRLEPMIARTADHSMPPVAAPRPVRLLAEPEPVSVVAEVPDGPPISMTWRRIGYRIVRAAGPERIEAEWWRDRGRLTVLHAGTPAPGDFQPEAALRDYYFAEDDTGRRFWLFRLGLYGAVPEPRWFLHGIFA